MPKYTGSPLDPPLRSRFQARDVRQLPYEQQLQQYEAEVRNHIKIEQQLKLHIECIQDKLDDTEKTLKRYLQDRNEVKE